MVAKIGSIDNLILHVIRPMIDSSFRNQASSTSAMNFLQDRQAEQGKAEERTRAELEKYHVECVSVLICQINLPQELMDTQTKKIIAQQQLEMYQAEGEAQLQRAATDKKRAQADMQPKLVEAEIGVQIAEQNRQKTVIAAEAEGEARRLNAEGEAAGIKAKGDAEASRILAIGKSTAEAYELQNKAIGGGGVTAIEIAKQVASGNVKITPDLLVQGGDGVGSLLSAYLSQLITRGTEQVAAVPAAKSAK
jgi:regulator of protease activity HflC (stomatin/prohibitin superfamily)